MPRRIFVTGTDTGVGKTVVTALLLAHAQTTLASTAALKPFCSGPRSDARLLFALEQFRGGETLSLDQINPFHFAEPVSPARAARLEGRTVRLQEALSAIERINRDVVLVEGAGGLLSPLGEGFSSADLIEKLRCEVILVARNRLGVLNHALLTLEALQKRGAASVSIALVGSAGHDESVCYNSEDLRCCAPGVPLIEIPFLIDFREDADFVRRAAAQMGEALNGLLNVSGPKI